MAEDSLTGIRDRMREFTRVRDWEKFHDPKSLTLALVGEVGELAELMQWLPADEVAELAQKEPLATRLGEEISDVLLYLVRLADVSGVDLPSAVESKMTSSEKRFPSSDFQGEAPRKE
jgi:NTP pyrophosphatase (non-canonical NTP hydrolase)